MENGKAVNNLSAYYEKKSTPTVKSYRNAEFLNSSEARTIRIQCELEESKWRLKKEGVKATVLVFGSARAKSRTQFDNSIRDLNAQKDSLPENDPERAVIDGQLERVRAGEWMCEYFDKVFDLSAKLTDWSINSGVKLAPGRNLAGVTRYAHHEDSSAEKDGEGPQQSFLICTGGGPGFMEAANMGSASITDARSIGMAISLPFEEGVNKYIPDKLAFQYHYFFTRKFWMVYYCQALIVAPGGVGTMDELFEVLTLKQTGKVQHDLPVVLLGATYWKTIINWEAIVNYGVVARKDYEDLFFTDSVDEAFEYVTSQLTTASVDSLPKDVHDVSS